MATTAPPEIQVYAPFPCAVVPGADLNVDPTNWHWVHCLTLPLETLNTLQFSPRPYKWIRYAIGVVVGAEGDLSSSPNSPNVVDYNANLKDESAVLYYHIGDEERRRMFPVDPAILRTNATSSAATTRRVQFHDNVAERDGRKCVLTGLEEEVCNAVHLLAHSKGDRYIATYTKWRSRSPTGGDIIEDIDSIRNGLLLNKYTHVALGTDVAFLMTPNFAMTTADVAHDADPTALPEEKRMATPFGPPLRISDTPEWPPSILFDAVYAGAILHHFGTQTLKDEVALTWKDIFYPGGIMTMAGADYKVIMDERAAAAERVHNQAQECGARYEACRGPDTFDMLMALPYIMVPQDKRKTMLREVKEKAEATEQRRVQEKVDTWIKQITAT